MTPRTKARQTDARAKGQTRKLATFLHALTYSDLGTAEVGTAKRLLLDYVGYATASAGERPSEILRALAGELGGRSEATVIGSRLRTNCLWASLINGCMGHMTELDDTHLGTSSHLGDGVFPAALAMGERCRADGKTVLAAVVAGYECGLRAGYSVMRGHYDKGWHPSGTLNAFAAAATAGKILGLDREAFLHALGLAGTQAAGNFAHLAIRGMAKDLNPGKGAFNGVLSALLAKEGFTGSLDIFENPKGFIRLYSDSPHPERLVRRLGEPFLIGEVAQKIYPGCYHAHSAREATLKLVGRHCLEPDHIRLITVRIFATGASLVDDPVPWKGGKGLHGPRFSAQFQVALAACEGEEGLWSSYDERFLIDKLAGRKIRRMMCKNPNDSRSGPRRTVAEGHARRGRDRGGVGREIFGVRSSAQRGAAESAHQTGNGAQIRSVHGARLFAAAARSNQGERRQIRSARGCIDLHGATARTAKTQQD